MTECERPKVGVCHIVYKMSLAEEIFLATVGKKKKNIMFLTLPGEPEPEADPGDSEACCIRISLLPLWGDFKRDQV